jgi:shikimate kinase
MKIFLIGMMGSGKSYWAQQLSAHLHTDWMDLDAEIEKEGMKTNAEIFETQGEAGFRQKERAALHQLAGIANIIIATGGGTPCFHNNMDWMNAQGTTIWLDEPVHTLAARLLPEKDHRPLIKHLDEQSLQTFLEKKREERMPFYRQAHYRLQSNDLSLDKLADICRR